MKTVFIYCLKDPITGDVRYIGQTNDLKNRLRRHLTTSLKLRTHLGNWLRSLSEPPVLVVLHEVMETECWQVEEQRYISCAHAIGIQLVNTSKGGEGNSGPRSPEARAALSARLKGVPKSPEWCAAISAALKGVPKSPEHRAALQAARSPEMLAKRGAAISAAKKGVLTGPFSPERCAAISDRMKGVPKSPEHRAALSAATKAHHSRNNISRDNW